MRRLVVADKARSDIGSIRRHSLKTWGAERTTDYLAELVSAMDRIRTRSSPGVARDTIARGYRSLRCGRHVIYFRLGADEALIARILHDRMDHVDQLRDT